MSESVTMAESQPITPWNEYDLPEPGDSFGRYVLLERIGSGGMGVVFAAYDPELDRKIALKLLRADRGKGDARARLLREAQAMARLSHANVISVYDVGAVKDQVFMAMELVEGDTVSAWLMQDERPVEQVLDVFIRAGRGLAAAHASGLIHRDFKPDNVLVGHDGRILVLDFGLAAPPGLAGSQPPAHAVKETIEGDGDDDSVGALPSGMSFGTEGSDRLTRAGMIMGTPAYMAPEQHAAAPTDERTDQYSFCVALYHGLYGERPFRASTMKKLQAAKLEGKVREPPSEREVPQWLRRALLRGLAVAPEARWPSMRTLLAVLSRNAAARRRRWIIAGAAAGLCGVGVWQLGDLRSPTEPTCTDGDAKLVGVWDADREAAIQRAFDATGLEYASETMTLIRSKLEAFSNSWVATHNEMCERGKQAPEVLDLSMACLHDRLSEANALVDVLSEADAKVMSRAAQAVASLSAPAECADTDTIAARVPQPDDGPTAAGARALRTKLGQAKAMATAGRYEPALSLAEGAVQEAKALGYRPVVSEALLRLGMLQDGTGDPETAEQTLEQAMWEAVAVHHDDVAATAASSLVVVVGYRQRRFDDAQKWIRHAEAATDRVGHGGPHEARLLNNIGLVRDLEGKTPEARDHFERAVTIGRSALGDDHPNVANSLNNLGMACHRMEQYDEARENYGRAIEIWERVLGAKHPRLATAFANLGSLFRATGDTDAALAHHERAISLWEGAFGPEHASLANMRSNLGNLLRDQKRFREARKEYSRALDISENANGKDHPTVALALESLAELEQKAGRPRRAIPLLERAVKIHDDANAPAPAARLRFALAQVLPRSEHARALELAERARDDLADTGPELEADRAAIDAWLSER